MSEWQDDYLTVKVVNLMGFIAPITINALVQPFLKCREGENTGECAKPYKYIGPDGWAFSIWGVIYGLLGSFAIY